MSEWATFALTAFAVIQTIVLWVAGRGLNRLNRMAEDVREMDSKVERLEEWKLNHDKQDDERERRHDAVHDNTWRAIEYDRSRRRGGE